jgi:HAD superfamily hydrolase (TIGR01458 family)
MAPRPRAVLADVDGTLLDHDRAYPGAGAAVDALRRAGIRVAAITNTTRRPRVATAEALRTAGIDLDDDEVFVPAALARTRIVESGATRAMLLVPDGCRPDFAGVREDDDAPDWVVVGDLGFGFGYERLNAAFRALRSGARLLALHKSRFWDAGPGRGLSLDAGPFVAALEYASGIAAEVLGKPSPDFFRLAARAIGVPPHEVLVVGDGIVNDVEGAASAGCATALVRTGAFRPDDLASASVRPGLVLGSIADLPAALALPPAGG